jgi:outer membrane protein OmpA-like peptidoglycan-associated protein
MATGNVPTEVARAEIATTLADAATGLTLAASAPDDWAAMARNGLAALGPMNHGEMRLNDDRLTISGQVLGPEQAAAVYAALAGLPGQMATIDLTLLDDGTPPAYSLTYSVTSGARLAGKLPPGLDAGSLALTLGLPAIVSEAKAGLLGDAGDASRFAAFSGLIGQFESLSIEAGPNEAQIEGVVSPGVDVDALGLVLGGFDVVLTQAQPEGINGTTRVNAATGLEQRNMAGYWLDVPQFNVSVSSCQAEVNKVLANARIAFQSGSDRLDPSAVAVINRLGSYMVRCAEELDARAEIGGHTDSQGDALQNLGLSQRRAVVVRLELIARGVPAAALRAQGFGDEEGVADNATAEGRALNRRTTIEWIE